MTTISFVVPTKNSARTIEACVRSLRQQRHADIEIVLVDNHSTDGTAELAAPWVDRVEIAGPERCAQRNLGASLTTGEFVVFIDSDMVLEPTIAEQIAARGAEGADAVVLPELAFGESFFARCRGLEKRLYLGDDTVEAPRGIRRTAFDAVGGWDVTLTAGEDWDLADRLRAHGAVWARTEGHVWHDEGVVRLRPQFKKKKYYGRWVAEFMSRSSQNRAHLARTSLFNRPSALLAEPLLAGGLVVLKGVEAAGLAIGMVAGRRGQR